MKYRLLLLIFIIINYIKKIEIVYLVGDTCDFKVFVISLR